MKGVSTYFDVLDEWAKDARELLESSSELIRAVAVERERQDEPPVVSIIGTFNAGKSSTLNALLGQQIASIGVLPTTAKVTRFKRGADTRVRILQDGEWRQSSLYEFQGLAHTKAASPQMEAELARIHEIEVRLDNPTLQDLIIVDTPGFGSGNQEDDEQAMSQLKDAAAFVWVVDVEKGGLPAGDLAVLDRLCRDDRPRYLLLNKADQKPPSERKKILEKAIRDHSSRFREIFLFSAELRQRPRIENDGIEGDAEFIDLDWHKKVLPELRAEAERLQARLSIQALKEPIDSCLEDCRGSADHLSKLSSVARKEHERLMKVAEEVVNDSGRRLCETFEREAKAMFQACGAEFRTSVDFTEGWLSNDVQIKEGAFNKLLEKMLGALDSIDDKLGGLIEEAFGRQAHELDVSWKTLISLNPDLPELLWHNGFDVDAESAVARGYCAHGVYQFMAGSIISSLTAFREFLPQVKGLGEFVSKGSRQDVNEFLDFLIDDEVALADIRGFAFGDREGGRLPNDCPKGEVKSHFHALISMAAAGFEEWAVRWDKACSEIVVLAKRLEDLSTLEVEV